MLRCFVRNSRFYFRHIINNQQPVALGYKSSINPENLYPNSTRDYLGPPTSSELSTSSDKFNGVIPVDQLIISYSRSSGPGGQNVNKVNSKVEVRFNVKGAKWIPDKAKVGLLEHYKTKLTKDGCLIIVSEKTRTQMLNLADCLDKIRHMIWKVSYEPPLPSIEDQQLMIKRREKAAQKRLQEKRQRSVIKESRQSPISLD